MKKRTGFVSNSSTSSFIVLACKVSDDILTPSMRESLIEKGLLLTNEGEEFLGKVLWSASDDSGYETMNFHEFRDRMAETYGTIYAKASELGIKAPVEVIYGVAYEGGFSEVDE